MFNNRQLLKRLVVIATAKELGTAVIAYSLVQSFRSFVPTYTSYLPFTQTAGQGIPDRNHKEAGGS